MVADGFATRRGRRAALVHRDEVNGTRARPARRAAAGADLRRRDSRGCRLPRRPRSRRHVHRHAERGLRDREQRRRRVPARQRVVAGAAGRRRRRARRRRARARRRRFRSGSARRRRAATSCRAPSATCASSTPTAARRRRRRAPGRRVIEWLHRGDRPVDRAAAEQARRAISPKAGARSA